MNNISLKFHTGGAFCSAIEITEDQSGFARLGSFVRVNEKEFTYCHQKTAINVIDIFSKSPVKGTCIESDLYFDPIGVELVLPDNYAEKTSAIGNFVFKKEPELWPSIRLVELGNPVIIPGFQPTSRRLLLYVGGRMTPVSTLDMTEKNGHTTIISRPRNQSAGNLHTKPQTLYQELAQSIKGPKPEIEALRKQYLEQLITQKLFK